MFTGIVHHQGRILELHSQAEAVNLRVQSTFVDWQLGESIAVDGICLTVTAFDRHSFCCDVSPETLSVTTAKHWRLGKAVNLERALQLTDRLGGHVVTGHVDALVQLMECQWRQAYLHMRFKPQDPEAMRYLCHKGSVALNGVSLTVNAVNDDDFEVLLIPHTLAHTNLSQASVGDWLNVEVDYLARYVVRQLQWIAKTS